MIRNITPFPTSFCCPKKPLKYVVSLYDPEYNPYQGIVRISIIIESWSSNSNLLQKTMLVNPMGLLAFRRIHPQCVNNEESTNPINQIRNIPCLALKFKRNI